MKSLRIGLSACFTYYTKGPFFNYVAQKSMKKSLMLYKRPTKMLLGPRLYNENKKSDKRKIN